ncbi:reverse transcriptase [Gossypium australe]|uniref:Reverse transcriptase n=1 Tax=Gossypium australe TaxID=47621 RepID=A0A5B6VXU5_9ROSI|nr:reverse transcriptase [Gossypium australe]
MAPLKASGTDGFPAMFFQKFWHIIGKDVSRYCLEILNNQKELDTINNTNIVLILKLQNPKNMGQFTPISLCNVVYKIISNAIVNRFRKALGYYIDDAQGAFVPSRQTTDNILMAYELLHSFKKKRYGIGNFTLKLDMSKAYDSILFEKAIVEGALAIRSVINDYEKISERIVNFEKSLIYFSNNFNEAVKLQIGRALGVRMANNLEKYLGLSKMVGRQKRNAFMEIKEKFLTKVKNWSIHNLSIREKEIRVFTGVGGRHYVSLRRRWGLLEKQGWKLITNPTG